EQLAFYKKAHHKDKVNSEAREGALGQKNYQVWEEGYQPKLLQTDEMMISKIKYIHENPVKRGYVDDGVHWRYSSARDYEGVSGLIEVDRFW
ncbi:MAG: hypothetical protein U9Q29_05845, partial [Campylobacterota bacterium]|nr:hypothetical protein [Campylobacterota bacterium]